MRLKWGLVPVLFVTMSWPQTANPGSVSGPPATNRISSLPVTQITGAKVDDIRLDDASKTATVTIRNVSDKTITAFDLAVRRIPMSGKSDISNTSFRLVDLLLGISAGRLEGIRPGETFDEILQGVSNNVTVDIDFVAFSDASSEFTNPEMLKHVITVRKAIADANNQTKDIIRNASSKEEAISNLTLLWEESKATAPFATATFATHLYNLKNQHGESEADEQHLMLEYANKNEKDAQFISVHANLHGRAQ